MGGVHSLHFFWPEMTLQILFSHFHRMDAGIQKGLNGLSLGRQAKDGESLVFFFLNLLKYGFAPSVQINLSNKLNIKIF